ncbi:MAG TPA: c-type cytochrome [Steroidobacteraceae bacterium]|nr:c-type cytochrome [Steroidobacteraceae bacterium]
MTRLTFGAAILLASTLSACARAPTYEPQIENGNAASGKLAMRRLQCNVCHTIPGIGGTQGMVGPPLRQYRRNVYVAGKFPNTANYLVQWIANPPALSPDTAMPALGVSRDDARDIAAYLYSLD